MNITVTEPLTHSMGENQGNIFIVDLEKSIRKSFYHLIEILDVIT